MEKSVGTSAVPVTTSISENCISMASELVSESSVNDGKTLKQLMGKSSSTELPNVSDGHTSSH